MIPSILCAPRTGRSRFRAAALAAMAAGAVGLSLVPASARAADHGSWRDRGRYPRHDFPSHEAQRWHGGHWWHGRHDGRFGWWWIVGSLWYWYPSPVYPYPDPYVPPRVVGRSGQYWYYCRHPQGYYPTVPVCRVPWEAVPAGPR